MTAPVPTAAEIESAFIAAITAAGLAAPPQIVGDGNLHRFSSNGKPGDDAGWLVFHEGDPAVGVFGCWRTGIKETWCSRDRHGLSAEERSAFAIKIHRAQAEQHRLKEVAQRQAREKAAADWERATEADPAHPYLAEKMVRAYGIRQLDGKLLVPLRDTDGALHGVQEISPTGGKNFPYGTAKRGHFHLIGEPRKQVIVAEGFSTIASIHEATGKAVAVAFDKGNLVPVAEALRQVFPKIEIVVAGDNDKDGGGQAYARKAAAAVDGKFAISPIASDFNDLHQARGLDAVRDAITAATEPEREPESIDDAIKRLAQLHSMEFDRIAEPEAKKLGCNVGTLRDEVKKARRKDGISADNGQGRPIKFAEIEPWPEPVDGATLLNAFVSTIRRYVIVLDVQAIAIALWALFTHVFDAFDVLAKLVAKSPQKRTGKSRLAEVLERLVPRALLTSGITPAALLRIIETHAPTLLIDEIDAAMKQGRESAEALRGLINSGFNKAAARHYKNVPMPDGGYEPRGFSTWAPQFLAGIGDLPDTVRDRSIEIEMKRKLRHETVKRLRRKDGNDLHELQRKAARWVIDNKDALRNSEPTAPPELGDRAADAWEPLFAIADLAGGDWPTRARTAAVALSGDGVAEDDNLGTMILSDIREVFESDRRTKTVVNGDKQITSTDLASALGEMADCAWADFRNGKAITATAVARLLKPYGIRPGTKRDGDVTGKGYRLCQFREAFACYLPVQTVTSSQTKQTAADSEFQTVTPDDDVTDEKRRKPAESATCDGVTDEMVPGGE